MKKKNMNKIEAVCILAADIRRNLKSTRTSYLRVRNALLAIGCTSDEIDELMHWPFEYADILLKVYGRYLTKGGKP